MSDTTELLREALDVLSQTPGAIIYRGPDLWEALEPGPLGYVLAIGEDGLPGWYSPDNLPGGGSL